MKYIDYDEVNFEDYTTEGYTLDHCVFCGSSDVELYGDQVQCERCEAHGPRVNNWELAVKAWNDMPRLTGDELKKQRSCWKSRYRRERQNEQRVAAEHVKAKRNSPDAKRDREYKTWAQKREAWLRTPVVVIGSKPNGR